MTPEGRLLAFETSGHLSGVAVTEDGRLLGEAAVDSRLARTELLLEIARRLLLDLGVTVDGISRVAFDEGPGSFTGIRIGMGAALGFGAGSGRPVVAVPSLEVLAYPHRLCGPPVVVLSGLRRGQVYAAEYRWTGERFEPLLEPASVPVERVFDLALPPAAERLLFVGDALDSLAESIRARFGARARIGATGPARAADLAALALDPDRSAWTGRMLEGRTPRYLRDADARKPGPGR